MSEERRTPTISDKRMEEFSYRMEFDGARGVDPGPWLGVGVTATELRWMMLEIREWRARYARDIEVNEGIARQQEQLYQIVKEQAEADDMIEVEPGHWVKPGEPWTDENGDFHA